MRTLVMTTGRSEPLVKTWLTSLRSKGEYSGDVLILDYDLDVGAATVLKNAPNVKVVKVIADTSITGGRIDHCRCKGFYDTLTNGDLYKNYDVIMSVDGNDVEFLRPIQPLLDMAVDKVCYVTERRLCKEWCEYRHMDRGKEIWVDIMDKPIINAGMYVGPAESIYKILKFTNDIQTSGFGNDQVILDTILYYHKIVASQEVSRIWNFDKRDITREDYANAETRANIAILHSI